jgi:hypothetical protein
VGDTASGSGADCGPLGGDCPSTVTTSDYSVTLTQASGTTPCRVSPGGDGCALSLLIICAGEVDSEGNFIQRPCCPVTYTCPLNQAGSVTVTTPKGPSKICVLVSAPVKAGDHNKRLGGGLGCCQTPLAAECNGGCLWLGRACAAAAVLVAGGEPLPTHLASRAVVGNHMPLDTSGRHGPVCVCTQAQMHLTHGAHVLPPAYTRTFSPHPCRCL